jgi:hypothetical protein
MTTGTGTYTTGLSIGGTATIASGAVLMEGQRLAAQGIGATQNAGFITTAFTTNRVVGASGTQAGGWFRMRGNLRFSAGGTFIPRFEFSAAPGTPISVLPGTYIALTKLSSGAGDLTTGTWS